jgi:alpha-tubulin suppressor-like RCC1 family protein
LGTNNTTNNTSPVQTVAGGTNWKQATVSDYATAAVKTDGTLWLWGKNDFGQLGDNTRTNRSSPVQTISAGTNWKQVSKGFRHAAAIKTDGTLWLWGDNGNGQLGDNTTTNRSSPVQTVAGGSNWAQVTVGNGHTAAIKTDGTLWLWGNNQYGNLGTNNTTNRSSPVQTISAGTNWKQVSSIASNNTGAIKTDGTLWMWGANNEYVGAGAIGDNTTTNRSSPVQTIAAGSTWKVISVGNTFAMAIK